MRIELLGAVTVVLGLIGWFAGTRLLLSVFVVATLFGAGAAIIVTALGYANIQPAHLLLGFLLIAAFAKRERLRAAFGSLEFPREGFWLLLTGIYALVSAMFLPRLFAGATYVYAIERTSLGPGIILRPLGPTSGNITQTLYFLGSMGCFFAIYSYASSARGFRAAVTAILICSFLNLVFVAADLITFWTQTADLLSFLRNANYRMLETAQIAGFKRIVGSFPEASSFAYTSIGWFAFSLTLWLSGISKRVTGVIALLTGCALVFATSSTGYFGTGILLLVMWLSCAWQVLTGPVTPTRFAFVLSGPPLLAALGIALALHEPAWHQIQTLVDKTIVYKLESDSGIERMRWTEQALANLFDTDGFGAGLGSVRASSFPIAVLGNIGVFGAICYAAFLVGTLFARRGRWTDPYRRAVQNAARYACFGQLAAATVSGSFVDLGLPFFIFAALACSGPLAAEAQTAVSSRAPRPAYSALGAEPCLSSHRLTRTAGAAGTSEQ